ncbi:uncharacterized protein METZ01_LOCUS374047, partial [marine metagenome]
VWAPHVFWGGRTVKLATHLPGHQTPLL